MIESNKFWIGSISEDSSFSILARVTSLDGTGEQVKYKEGKCLTQADLTSITCKVFALGEDRDSVSGTLVASPTVVIANSIYDELQTNGWDVSKDYAGYNFRYDFPETILTSPGTSSLGNWYQIEFTFTLTNGSKIYLKCKIKTIPILSS